MMSGKQTNAWKTSSNYWHKNAVAAERDSSDYTAAYRSIVRPSGSHLRYGLHHHNNNDPTKNKATGLHSPAATATTASTTATAPANNNNNNGNSHSHSDSNGSVDVGGHNKFNASQYVRNTIEQGLPSFGSSMLKARVSSISPSSDFNHGRFPSKDSLTNDADDAGVTQDEHPFNAHSQSSTPQAQSQSQSQSLSAQSKWTSRRAAELKRHPNQKRVYSSKPVSSSSSSSTATTTTTNNNNGARDGSVSLESPTTYPNSRFARFSQEQQQQQPQQQPQHLSNHSSNQSSSNHSHQRHSSTRHEHEEETHNNNHTSSSPPQRQPPPPEPDHLLSASWWYKDPTGQEQGPFEQHQMRQWFEGGYFPQNLPIRCNQDTPFVELKHWFLQGMTAFLSEIPLKWPQTQEDVLTSYSYTQSHAQPPAQAQHADMDMDMNMKTDTDTYVRGPAPGTPDSQSRQSQMSASGSKHGGGGEAGGEKDHEAEPEDTGPQLPPESSSTQAHAHRTHNTFPRVFDEEEDRRHQPVHNHNAIVSPASNYESNQARMASIHPRPNVSDTAQMNVDNEAMEAMDYWVDGAEGHDDANDEQAAGDEVDDEAYSYDYDDTPCTDHAHALAQETARSQSHTLVGNSACAMSSLQTSKSTPYSAHPHESSSTAKHHRREKLTVSAYDPLLATTPPSPPVPHAWTSYNHQQAEYAGSAGEVAAATTVATSSLQPAASAMYRSLSDPAPYTQIYNDANAYMANASANSVLPDIQTMNVNALMVASPPCHKRERKPPMRHKWPYTDVDVDVDGDDAYVAQPNGENETEMYTHANAILASRSTKPPHHSNRYDMNHMHMEDASSPSIPSSAAGAVLQNNTVRVSELYGATDNEHCSKPGAAAPSQSQKKRKRRKKTYKQRKKLSLENSNSNSNPQNQANAQRGDNVWGAAPQPPVVQSASFNAIQAEAEHELHQIQRKQRENLQRRQHEIKQQNRQKLILEEQRSKNAPQSLLAKPDVPAMHSNMAAMLKQQQQQQHLQQHQQQQQENKNKKKKKHAPTAASNATSVWSQQQQHLKQAQPTPSKKTKNAAAKTNVSVGANAQTQKSKSSKTQHANANANMHLFVNNRSIEAVNKVSAELQHWIRTEIKKLNPDVEAASVAHLLLTLDDDMAKTTAYHTFGTSKDVSTFVDSFLVHRSHDFQQQKHKSVNKSNVTPNKKKKTNARKTRR